MKHTFAVDGQPLVASSVINLTLVERSGMAGGAQFSTGLTAEAAFADFGQLGLVFVPMKSAQGRNNYPLTVFLEEAVNFRKLDEAERLSAVKQLPQLTKEVVLQEDDWPMIIAFGDIQQPGSAVELNPANMFPDSSNRVTLESSSLQVVDAPVSRGIVSKLPWLPSLSGSLSGAKFIPPRGPAVERLSQTDFKIG